MKEIHYAQIVSTVRNLCIQANTQLSPDLRMSVQAFSQLVCGYTDLASARFRRDVEILTENPAPARAFAKKPLYVGYYY